MKCCFQLAINHAGGSRGNFCNALTDTSTPVFGFVNKTTQCAAWVVGDRKEPVEVVRRTRVSAASETHLQRRPPMQIKLASIMVDDQDKALHFYTAIVGFVKKEDIPMGPFRWLTVTSPEGAAGVELVLEPMGFPPAQAYQKALFDAGIPATAFITMNVNAECQRLKALGVVFRGEPCNMGPITAVLFEDTCGNLINLVQPPA
jgi:catechol 2,3-dioxygenase-like lactoylglutathione lyase family enzyme